MKEREAAALQLTKKIELYIQQLNGLTVKDF
jgi:hypothetical protein